MNEFMLTAYIYSVFPRLWNWTYKREIASSGGVSPGPLGRLRPSPNHRITFCQGLASIGCDTHESTVNYSIAGGGSAHI